MIGGDDDFDDYGRDGDGGSWGSQPPAPPVIIPEPVAAPAQHLAAGPSPHLVEVLIEEMPRGAPPGSRPVRTPLATVEVLAAAYPGAPGACTLPPFAALVLRMVPGPPPAPGAPPTPVQDFDKNVDRIRRLPAFACRAVGPGVAKLDGFLGHLSQRGKVQPAERLICALAWKYSLA